MAPSYPPAACFANRAAADASRARGLFFDHHPQHPLSLADGVHHILAGDHLAENGMLAVEVGLRRMGDEELAAVGVGAGVGHGEGACPVRQGVALRFVGEADFAGKTEYLKKAKCLLFPILWEEPFGLVMVEALACGTPVAAFRRGSVPEIIQDGDSGFIVDNVDEMVEAVGKTETISAEKCRESVEKRFSVERMVDEYESAFEKIAVKNK